MLTCSACGREFRLEEGQTGGTETRFNILCPNCGEGVIPDGDAEEIRRQLAVQKKIIKDIQVLAEETKSPSYEGPQHSIQLLRDRLQQIIDDIDSELARRSQ